MRKGRLKDLRVVLAASKEGTGRWQRYDRPRRPASQVSVAREDTACKPLVSSRQLRREKAAHLSNNEVLRELGKSDNLVEHFGLLIEKVTAAHELHWVGPHLKKALRARLVAVRLAQDLRRVDKQTPVTRPCAIAHVSLHEGPSPSIIPGEVCFSMALSPPVTRATLVTRPDNPIRMVWVELQYLSTKRVRWLRCGEGIPRATRICCVVELARGGDEVSAVRRKEMMVESEEGLLWEKAIPRVTLIAGLPDRRV